MRQKFEYCQAFFNKHHKNIIVENGRVLLPISGKNFLDVFNKLGELGWEMCGNHKNHFYFKRPV